MPFGPTEFSKVSRASLTARAHLQATLDAIPDLLFEVDLHGRYLQVHAPRKELLAAPIEQCVGRTIDEVMPPDVAAVCMASIREANDTGRSDGLKFELALPQGRLWFELSVARKPTEPGAVPAFILLSRDITARHRAEEALRAGDAQLECILASTADGILAVDCAGRVIQANRRFAELWRIPSSVLAARDDQMLLDHVVSQVADPAAFLAGVGAIYATDTQLTDTLLFRDGRIFERFTAPLISRGATLGRVWSFRDITARSRAEQRVRMATEATHLVFWELDLENDRLLFDADMARLGLAWEHPPATLRAWVERMHSDDRTGFLEVIASTIQRGDQAVEFEYRMRDGSPREVWLHTHAQVAQRDAEGRATLVVGTSMNITQRKLAEAALRESEARSSALAVMLRLLCDNVPDMIWAQDLEQRFLFANKAVCEQLLKASSTDEPIGRTASFFAERERARHPDDTEWQTFGAHAPDSDVITLANGGPSRFEESGNVGGTLLFLEVNKAPFHCIDGKIIGTVGSGRDITARKRAEKELEERDSRLSAIFKSSPLPIFVTRLSDGVVVDANDAARRLYSTGDRGFDDESASVVSPFSESARGEEMLRLLRVRGAVDGFPLELQKPNGEVHLVEASCRVIELNGEPRVVATLMDVSERKRLEESHLQAQKLESLGTLAGGIAHDFNNILAAIRANAELASEVLGAQHAALESLTEIRAATSRASELVRRIMVFGRPKEPRHEVIDLSLVVEEVLRLLRSTLPARILLRTEFAGGGCWVIADAGQVHEVVVNLTTNAAHAIGSGCGSITYRLDHLEFTDEHTALRSGLRVGRFAGLVVTDTGCGMSASEQERIFDAFYTTKSVGEGTGFGLSMVHGIMKSHAGAVKVESTPGTGSSFSVYFRAASGDRAAGSPESGAPFGGATSASDASAGHGTAGDGTAGDAPAHVAPAQVTPVPGGPPGGKRPTTGRHVLFVDDEAPLVRVAERMLTRLGHKVSAFTDPRIALAQFRARPDEFDLLVTDLSMPSMSGIELARAFTAERPGFPIILATGWVRTEDEVAAREAGVRELVQKPVSMGELSQVIGRVHY